MGAIDVIFTAIYAWYFVKIFPQRNPLLGISRFVCTGYHFPDKSNLPGKNHTGQLHKLAHEVFTPGGIICSGGGAGTANFGIYSSLP
ncbi:MAG TPA: hypothetical protein VG847_10180 [Chitinophagaceae bacterium]|nr:hypothetical protein [Chitinophagaceae bacterium]